MYISASRNSIVFQAALEDSIYMPEYTLTGHLIHFY